jgi:predicted dehydrogenase
VFPRCGVVPLGLRRELCELKSFGWALVGTGQVTGHFLRGLSGSKLPTRAVYIVSRDSRRAETFAKVFKIPAATANFETALRSKDVDAVYIATPPSSHMSLAARAIKYRKHVLVEKPFADNLEDAQRIVEDAREASVLCMEGVWTRFLPLVQEVKSALVAGVAGDIRTFDACFQSAVLPHFGGSVFNRGAGGGALSYRGVYGISLSRYFFGPFESFRAYSTFGESGVDEESVVILRHAAGTLSTVRASLRTTALGDAVIAGTRASISICGPVYRPNRAVFRHVAPRGVPTLRAAGRCRPYLRSIVPSVIQAVKGSIGRGVLGAGTRLTRHFHGNGFPHEIDAFIITARAGRTECSVMPPEETLDVMKVIDRVLAGDGRG